MNCKQKNMIWALLLGLFFITTCGGGGGGTTYTVITEPNLSLSETSYDFAGVVLNNSADRMFTITNNGTHAGLVINGISASAAPFSITSDNCTSQSLAINASCTFIVRFLPTAQGAATGTISIASNDPPTRTLSLTGMGYGLNVWINQIISEACGVGGVVFDVTVTNPNGVLVALDESNFTILTQNGVAQSITGFTTTDPDSVSAVITLDLSSSLTSALGNIRTAAKYFIGLMADTDEAAMFKFKNDILPYPLADATFIPTDGPGTIDLEAKIDAPDPVVAGTAFYDAVYAALERAKTGIKSTKAVVVLSDGSNQGTPIHTLAQVITYANTAPKVPVFTIYYVDPAYAAESKPAIMDQLAEQTGGQDFYADTTSMNEIFDQIWALLSKKYRITYTPTTCATGSQSLQVGVSSGGLTGLDTKTLVFP